jgi:hypothetical protein
MSPVCILGTSDKTAWVIVPHPHRDHVLPGFAFVLVKQIRYRMELEKEDAYELQVLGVNDLRNRQGKKVGIRR